MNNYSLIRYLRRIKEDIEKIIDSLWWCDKGRKIVIKIAMFEPPSSLRKTTINLYDARIILQEIIEKLETTNLDQYAKNLLMENVFYLIRITEIIRDAHDIIGKAKNLLKRAEGIARSIDKRRLEDIRTIVSNLGEIISEVSENITNKETLNRYAEDDEMWKTLKEGKEKLLDIIEKKLDVIEKKLGKKMVTHPPTPTAPPPIHPIEELKRIVASSVIFGEDIGRKIGVLIANSKSRIYILTQELHRVRIRANRRRINLLGAIIGKAREGVDVIIVSRDPRNLPGVPLRYISALKRLYEEKIKCRLCWHMHMKIILIDNTLFIGSANFTAKGLKGYGEIALVIKGEKSVGFFTNVLRGIYEKKHPICKKCPESETNKCGLLKDLYLDILKDLLKRAKERGYQKAIEIISNIIKEINP